jgi:hypothetical protein
LKKSFKGLNLEKKAEEDPEKKRVGASLGLRAEAVPVAERSQGPQVVGRSLGPRARKERADPQVAGKSQDHLAIERRVDLRVIGGKAGLPVTARKAIHLAPGKRVLLLQATRRVDPDHPAIVRGVGPQAIGRSIHPAATLIKVAKMCILNKTSTSFRKTSISSKPFKSVSGR